MQRSGRRGVLVALVAQSLSPNYPRLRLVCWWNVETFEVSILLQ